ncbi:MAG: polysaccharide pyruvyl transferase family protein [Planctomycetota bacterium]|jgi:hypothetical protein|nr:polysaccharide pyruvyl transferase family protein [Planctomycetota bacterium]
MSSRLGQIDSVANAKAKYGRLCHLYHYDSEQEPSPNKHPIIGNLGDAIQSIAVTEIYRKMGVDIDSLLPVSRDDLNSYSGPVCTLPMQGWFAKCGQSFPFPWSKRINPAFVGFHLSNRANTRKLFIKRRIHEAMKRHEPIGCRDRNTASFLQGLNVDAYFSGCLTLTFEKRKRGPAHGKVFVVDLTLKMLNQLPRQILERADYSITHYFAFRNNPLSMADCIESEQAAQGILDRYREEAELIVTDKIHCAMPCIAMGIPVVFITNNVGDARFDVLRGLLPLNSHYEMNRIDWNPPPVDFEGLKSAIANNAMATIEGAQRNDRGMRSRFKHELLNMTTAMEEIFPSNWTRCKRKAVRAIASIIPFEKTRKKIRRLG